MSRFFIDTADLRLGRRHRHHAGRPVGAAVTLPISQYPQIAPTTVNISATYPGADAQTVENSVTKVIEQGMTGVDNLQYMTATSTSTGNGLDHADLHQRGRSRRRADAGAEQAAARHLAIAAGGAEHRHHRVEILDRLPDGRRLRLQRRQDVLDRPRRLCRLNAERHAQARRRRRLDASSSARAMPCASGSIPTSCQIRADAERRLRRDRGAEHAGLGRPARRPAAEARASSSTPR
jgi:hypothetical protein